MLRRSTVAIALAVTLCLAVVAVASAEDVGVQVSPKVLYLNSQGTWVTLHVDVAFAQLDEYTVTINGVEATVANDFADLQGNLVVKLDRDLVKTLVTPGVAIVAVAGTLEDGTEFSGTQEMPVH